MCPFCGATVRSVLGKGLPLPAEVVREFEEEKREREADQVRRRTRRLKRDALAGALIFCAFGVLLLAAQTFLSLAAGVMGRASGRSLAKSFLLGLVLIPVYAAALGAPMGLLVSERRPGFLKAGLAGALVFFASYFLLGMRFMLGPVQTPVTILLLPCVGFVYGGVLSVGLGTVSEE